MKSNVLRWSIYGIATECVRRSGPPLLVHGDGGAAEGSFEPSSRSSPALRSIETDGMAVASAAAVAAIVRLECNRSRTGREVTVVTGATGGLGREMVRRLALLG